MPDSKELLQCYNRGCGQKFDPENNNEDSCRYHPGEPIFHDAYKGWGCCNKKCTDFTEFLNIKGCTVSRHSNVKPPEAEKIVKNNLPDIIEVKPIVPTHLARPPLDSPLIPMKPTIAPSLLQQLGSLATSEGQLANSNEITIGTACKNGGCSVTYQGSETNSTTCIYHPGVPIFHEGMKYWSCCQKKTSDFDSFLNQVGCEKGTHTWKKHDENSQTVNCRWDFHQTASHVYVSVYAKQYCPKESIVKLNPIRLFAKLVFLQKSNTAFVLDIELKGIIDVDQSEVSMFGTKVEIKMKKAEPGSWTKLGEHIQYENKPKVCIAESITSQVDNVNLDDL